VSIVLFFVAKGPVYQFELEREQEGEKGSP